MVTLKTVCNDLEQLHLRSTLEEDSLIEIFSQLSGLEDTESSEDLNLTELLFQLLDKIVVFENEECLLACLFALRQWSSSPKLASVFSNGKTPEILVCSVDFYGDEVHLEVLKLLNFMLLSCTDNELGGIRVELYQNILSLSNNNNPAVMDQGFTILKSLSIKSAVARAHLGSVGVLSFYTELYESPDTVQSKKDDCFMALMSHCKDSNSRVRMVTTDSPVLDIIISQLTQQSGPSLHGHCLSALTHFEFSPQGQLALVNKGLIAVLLPFLKSCCKPRAEISEASSSSRHNRDSKRPSDSRKKKPKQARLDPSIYERGRLRPSLLKILYFLSTNCDTQHKLCTPTFLSSFVRLTISSPEPILFRTLLSLAGCPSLLDSVFSHNLLLQLLETAEGNAGLDLSRIPCPSSNRVLRKEMKIVMKTLLSGLLSSYGQTVLANEMRILKSADVRKGDEMRLAMLYMIKYSSNISQFKPIIMQTQAHKLALSKLNSPDAKIRHLAQSSFFMLLTALFLDNSHNQRDKLLQNKLLIPLTEDEKTDYTLLSNQQLMFKLLNQSNHSTTINDDSSVVSDCRYDSYRLEYNCRLQLNVAEGQLTIPVLDHFLSNSEYFYRGLSPLWSTQQKEVSFGLGPSDSEVSHNAMLSLVHLLHECQHTCNFLRSNVAHLATARRLVKLCSLTMVSLPVINRLHHLLITLHLSNQYSVRELFTAGLERNDTRLVRLLLAYLLSTEKQSTGVYSYLMTRLVLVDAAHWKVSLLAVDYMVALFETLIQERLAAIN